MDLCYCANYYCSIRCTNKVTDFGQRCKLCTIMKSGASLSPGLLPDDCSWSMPSVPRRVEDDSSAEGSGLVSWASTLRLGPLSLSPSFKK
ncbi:hypothetical protein VTK26DRAFT_8376 [Humicola hyalothermophila]